MSPGKRIANIIIWLGVVLLQIIMTQVITFLVSLFLPNVEGFQQTQPVLFAAMVGATFSTGVFLTGWLALKWGWLKTTPRYLPRLLATLVGAYLPLIGALIYYRVLEAGNPFFFISTLAAILGFHIPGWVGGKREV